MPERSAFYTKVNSTRMINWKHLLPVLIPFSIALFAGVLGVDFGHHWDEGKLVPQLRDTIRTGTLLPGWYRYPSVVYWLNLLGLIPYILGIVSKGNFYLEDLRAYLIDVVGGDVFRIQVRWVFIFISALAIIWVYLLIYVWRNRNWIEALTGALLFGLSWEVNYHSRWIAPDAILMQFGALTMLCIVLALQPNSKRPWLWGAAIAAGLGLGTKYPGGLLIVPVLFAAYRLRERFGWGLFLEVLLAFGCSFLLSTPGVILQTKIFFSDVFSEVAHYQTGHYGYSVSSIEHLGLIFTYFSQVVFSHYTVISLIVFISSLFGIFALISESWNDAVLFLSFPFLYVLVFIFQRVMIVRNLLVLIPFSAILSARGIHYMWGKLHVRLTKVAFVLLISGIVIANGIWMIRAAQSITHRGTSYFSRALITFFSENSEIQYFSSGSVVEELDSLNESIPSNVGRGEIDTSDMVVFYASEGMDTPLDWPRNRPGLATNIFGPWEVNFDYYPTWAGDDRILVIPLAKAQELGIKVLPEE